MCTKQAERGRLVIVLAEDELLVRMMAAAALLDAGFEVVETGHADEALAALSARAPEIHGLFTDIHMPSGSIDGLALAHHARRNWPWIAILVVSAETPPHPAQLPSESRFVAKPYRTEHVVQHLREMVAGA